jgi:hypothetical protein
MELIEYIKMTLSNDEDSTDAELRDLFLSEGATEQVADEWIARRAEALSSPFGLD